MHRDPGPMGRVIPHLWNGYASVYDGLLDLVSYRRLLDEVAHAAGVLPGQQVVEVGCGTGNVLLRLAQAGPARLIGIDASPCMLGHARGKLDSAGLSGVELWVGDLAAQLTCLSSRSVDRLVAVNVLYAIPDRTAFWIEAARVLADDGEVIVSNPDRRDTWPLVREQLAEEGVRGAMKPRLLAVTAYDAAILLLERHRRFDFCPFERLAAEADAAGLRATDLGRSYGGPRDGINVLARVTRTPEPARVR